MVQILHKRATTTHQTRAMIIASQESVPTLAKRFGVNHNTIRKWKARGDVHDKPMGNGRSNSNLSIEEDKIICQLRRKTWLPLDDLHDILKPVFPKLSRSALHRCLQYYGISCVPKELQVKKHSKPFYPYEVGYIHIDITEFYLQKRKWFLFVAIDRTSKLCYANLFENKTNPSAVTFLEQVIAFFPYKIHRILTDNGMQFTYRGMPTIRRPKLQRHPFTQKCLDYGIKHKLTPFYSPHTNGQVERMNHTIKEATLKQFHYQSIDQFKQSLAHFLNYYNCQKPLKSLKRIPPYQFVINLWQNNPKLFHKNPTHHCVGLDK